MNSNFLNKHNIAEGTSMYPALIWNALWKYNILRIFKKNFEYLTIFKSSYSGALTKYLTE